MKLYTPVRKSDGTCEMREVGWPEHDWDARLYTTTGQNSYVVSRKGDELTNCFNDNGRIHVVCNNHKLGKGRLQVEFHSKIPNSIYPDGIENLYEPQRLDIELVDGPGDSLTVAEAEVMMPYIKGDKGDAFTYGDFTRMQIAELQRPATQKVTEVTTALSRVKTKETEITAAEALRQTDEIARVQAAALRAEQFTELKQASESATDAAVSAAIVATSAASDAQTAISNANAAATNANAAAANIEAAKLALFDDMWASIGGVILDNGLYRMGADGKELTLDEALVRYERNPFIEHWNSLFKIQTYNYYGSVKITDNGGYNEKTCLYEGNGLTDITHEQAMSIDAVPRPTVRTLPTMWYAGYNMRTNICTRSDKADYIPFFGQYRIEVIALSDNTEIPQGLCYQCFRLHTIKGVLKLTGSSFANQCGALRNITVCCTKAGVSYNFGGNPKLSLESVKYTVDNTTVVCTLIYHPDVYAKLTGDTTNAAAAELTEEELAQWQEVLATAVSKNITVATI